MLSRWLLVGGFVVLAMALAACGQASTTSPAVVGIEQPAAATVEPVPLADTPAPTAAARSSGPAAPELIGGGPWLNSEPLTLAGLRGKVVLIDFWTYGCINCQRTLPYVQGWWEKYKDQGLVIIGVHTPEFQSEHDRANVQAAMQRLGVTWPVVQDNDSNIWRAYRNNYWPRFYLLNREGQIIYDRIGEGGYDEIERQIVAALGQ
ncbi:MAG: thioredoxin family protein [Chloroflexaceae bacterium]|jgi:thiol-disulfide isomerase/thioredoxin|nr:thioredoxin family protein [Chloroflexaceae bacterium]